MESREVTGFMRRCALLMLSCCGCCQGVVSCQQRCAHSCGSSVGRRDTPAAILLRALGGCAWNARDRGGAPLALGRGSAAPSRRVFRVKLRGIYRILQGSEQGIQGLLWLGSSLEYMMVALGVTAIFWPPLSRPRSGREVRNSAWHLTVSCCCCWHRTSALTWNSVELYVMMVQVWLCTTACRRCSSATSV